MTEFLYKNALYTPKNSLFTMLVPLFILTQIVLYVYPQNRGEQNEN